MFDAAVFRACDLHWHQHFCCYGTNISFEGWQSNGGGLKWHDVLLKDSQFLFRLYRCLLNAKQQMDTLCNIDRLSVCGALLRDQHIFQFVTENEDLDILGPRNVMPDRKVWNLVKGWLYFGTECVFIAMWELDSIWRRQTSQNFSGLFYEVELVNYKMINNDAHCSRLFKENPSIRKQFMQWVNCDLQVTFERRSKV